MPSARYMSAQRNCDCTRCFTTVHPWWTAVSQRRVLIQYRPRTQAVRVTGIAWLQCYAYYIAKTSQANVFVCVCVCVYIYIYIYLAKTLCVYEGCVSLACCTQINRCWPLSSDRLFPVCVCVCVCVCARLVLFLL